MVSQQFTGKTPKTRSRNGFWEPSVVPDPLTDNLPFVGEKESSSAGKLALKARMKRASISLKRFAFVIHPLSIDYIHRYPPVRWTRHLPDRMIELIGAHFPPLYLSRMTGIESPETGERAEGYLFSLGAIPQQLMKRHPSFTYRRLVYASKMAQRRGAKVMGLGAFTSVVGDAGVSVAKKSKIAITTGNSLTVVTTLHSAREAMIRMGNGYDWTPPATVMIIGATGSIGSACSRLLAQKGFALTLVARNQEKLRALERTIKIESPGVKVITSTVADPHLGKAGLVVVATSSVNSRILDIMLCKPGAVICDVSRPSDVIADDAKLRPDVLVVDSSEVKLPGMPDIGYDIGLPPGVAYGCLAETVLLALEGRFEHYTIGRQIDLWRVEEMERLFHKHDFKMSGLRSYGRVVTDEEIIRKRALAREFGGVTV
jgi:predicted amino acid dehydrogenase